MVTRDTTWPPGTPSWVDAVVDDMDKATAFYTGLFGWDIQVDPNPLAGGYAMGKRDGRDVAGIGPKQDPQMPSAWTTYLAVDDVDQIVGKINDAGGQVIMEPFDVMEHGRMAIASDPGGAVFGLWQARKHIGMGRANEPGSVTWNENMSRDHAGNRKFYNAVFGYEYEEMGDESFPYATMRINGNDVGGIGEVQGDSPAHWMTYFMVEDTDAAVAKLTELGGSVMKPAFDSSQGRIAIVSDDQGAVFALINQQTS